MPEFDIVFEMLKVALAAEASQQDPNNEKADHGVRELDEIEELRRYAAEIQEPDPTSYTIT